VSDSAGKTIGKYEVLEEIGASVAGKTYRALDPAANSEIALKVLECTPEVTDAAKSAFFRELEVCRELKHPHNVQILDAGECDGLVYVATELLQGVDLHRHLAEHRVLTLQRKVELIAQVCDAVSLLHRHDVAHGDIKPSNIFVVGDQDARVLDYGIGHWLESMLAEGWRVGGLVPNHLAPEQILGQPFDEHSDVFSIAVIFYELLTERYPFRGGDGVILREIVHSQPESLRSLVPDIPEELERMIFSALHKDPRQRLQTSGEFAAGLYSIALTLRNGHSNAVDVKPVPKLGGLPAFYTSEVAADKAEPFEAAKPLPALLVEPVAPAATAFQMSAPAPKKELPQERPVAAAAPPPPPAAVVKPAPPPPPPAQPKLTPMAAPPQLPPIVIPAPPSQSSVMRRRLIVYGAAVLLTLIVAIAIFSRQSMRATPPSRSVTAPPAQSAAPPTQQSTVTQEPAPAPSPAEKTAAPAEEPKAQPSQNQVLLNKVKTLWESGKYARAMALVNEVLADEPDNLAAQAWKKKIRAAQDAEAAIK